MFNSKPVNWRYRGVSIIVFVVWLLFLTVFLGSSGWVALITSVVFASFWTTRFRLPVTATYAGLMVLHPALHWLGVEVFGSSVPSGYWLRLLVTMVLSHVVAWQVLVPGITSLWEALSSRPAGDVRVKSPLDSPRGGWVSSQSSGAGVPVERSGSVMSYGIAGGTVSSAVGMFGTQKVSLGVKGERVVHRSLVDFFRDAPAQVAVLSGVNAPNRGGFATDGDIDHVVVIGSAVYLIDAKYYGAGEYSYDHASNSILVNKPHEGEYYTRWSSSARNYQNVDTFLKGRRAGTVLGSFVTLVPNFKTDPAKFSITKSSQDGIIFSDVADMLNLVKSNAVSSGQWGVPANPVTVSALNSLRK